MTHGVYSADVVEPRIPDKIEQNYELMPWLIEADREGVKSFAWICVQEDLFNEELGRRGGSLIGNPKLSGLWKEIQLAKREWMKILAMGPGPRSQYAQAMSGAGKNMIEVRSGLKALHEELRQPSKD